MGPIMPVTPLAAYKRNPHYVVGLGPTSSGCIAYMRDGKFYNRAPNHFA